MRYVTICILLILSGCKLQRDIAKTTTRTDQQTSTTSQVISTMDDKTRTIITTIIDDTVPLLPVNINASGVGTSVTTIHGTDTLKASYDPKTNTIYAGYTSDGKKVPVKKTTRTETVADVRKATIIRQDSTGSSSSSTSTKDVSVKQSFQWFWLVGGVLVVLLAIWVYHRFGWIITDIVRRIKPP